MHVAIVGSYDNQELARVRREAADVGYVTTVHETLAGARRHLASGLSGDTRCVLLQAPHRTAAPFIASLRRCARAFATPVVMLMDEVSDHAFRRAHVIGADDVASLSRPGDVMTRLQGLAQATVNVRPPATSGSVIVLHSDDVSRTLLGRVLRMAGFDVQYAACRADALELAAADDRPRLLVAGDATPASQADMEEWRNALPDMATVFLGAADDVSRIDQGVAVIQHGAPADSLLFVVNELLRRDLRDTRKSPRVLYSTVCGFRSPGEHTQSFGLSYNLSGEGLFVRTHAAPTCDAPIWVELAPEGHQPMQLRGRVAWVRRPGTGPGLTPPGFGVWLDLAASARSDRQAYVDLYESLVRETGRRRSAPVRLSRPFLPNCPQNVAV